MEREFILKFSNKGQKSEALTSLIKTSIKGKLIKEVAEKSQEEKEDNHYVPIEPEIPKSKKGIEKAIDKFIADFSPLEDEAEELLSFLGFYDEEPPYNKKPLYKLLHAKITEETKAKEITEIVKSVLTGLPVEELYKLWVFGIPVTEEEAKENIENWVTRAAENDTLFLFFYAVGKWKQTMCEDEPEDAIAFSAKENYKIHREVFTTIYPEDIEEPEKLNEYKERATKAIESYPKETLGFYRGFIMLQNNYSERAIIATVKEILSNEL
jgi:hypothetical protein